MRTSCTTPSGDAGDLKGRHVLFLFVGFFAAVFAVNGYFLYEALSTHSGVVAVEPYRKGLAYNARIAADARQAERGWREEVDFSPDGTLAVTLIDRAGEAVSGLTINGVLGRPSTEREDRPLRFSETEPGRYTAGAGTLEPGTWVVTIEARTATNDAEPAYRARRRLWLKP